VPTRKVGAKKAPATPRSRALAEGYRSGLEETIARSLIAKGHDPQFEAVKIPFKRPETKHTYTPDFILHNGIVIESKGRFMTADRQKHILIKAQHPNVEIRFVFSNSEARLSKGSPTTYAMWCEKNGFLYATKTIPLAWLEELPERVRVEALAAVAITKKKSTP
jgi:hypothetical protein